MSVITGGKTKFGQILQADNNLIGNRIFKDKNFGTILYVGDLPGSSETWLGVDWDDSNIGKHDGTFKGKRYFQAHADKSGSFLKAKSATLGSSIEEMLVTNFCLCDQCQIKQDSPDFENIRLVDSKSANNFEKEANINQAIQIEFYSNDINDIAKNNHDLCSYKRIPILLPTLDSINLDYTPIYDTLCSHNDCLVETWNHQALGDLSNYTGNVKSLSLVGTLISNWANLSRICQRFVNLLNLNISKCRIRNPKDLSEFKNVTDFIFCHFEENLMSKNLFSPFIHVNKLVAVDMGGVFSWDSIELILTNFPSLKHLSIAKNKLRDYPMDKMERDQLKSKLAQLESLDIAENSLKDFQTLCEIISAENSQLFELNINGNEFQKMDYEPKVRIFPKLTTLSMLYNPLVEEEFCFNLLYRIQSLESILFPFSTFITKLSFEDMRQEVFARFSHLKLINHQTIDKDEQRGAEIDFLKKHFKEFTSYDLKEDYSVSLDHERCCMINTYLRLVKIYGLPTEAECKVSSLKLKDNLVKITINQLDKDEEIIKTVKKSFPFNMEISRLNLIVSKLFKLDISNFKLRKRIILSDSDQLRYDFLEMPHRTLVDYSISDEDSIDVLIKL